jgi:hypothetical protein
VGGDLVATRFRIRASVAGSAFSISKAVVDRCLITDNGVSTLVFGHSYGSSAVFHNCTIANNSLGGSDVFVFNDYPSLLDLANDIVDQPGTYTAFWDSGGGGLFNVN